MGLRLSDPVDMGGPRWRHAGTGVEVVAWRRVREGYAGGIVCAAGETRYERGAFIALVGVWEAVKDGDKTECPMGNE